MTISEAVIRKNWKQVVVVCIICESQERKLQKYFF